MTDVVSREIWLFLDGFSADRGVFSDPAAGEVPVLEILIHEMTHVWVPELRHGGEFDRIVRSACAEVGMECVYHA